MTVPDIVQQTAGLRYRLTDPKPAGPDGIRFTIVFETEAGQEFGSVFGYRVLKGHVYPPARKHGRSWIDQARFSKAGLEAIEARVREWEGQFTNVEFPKSGEEKNVTMSLENADV